MSGAKICPQCGAQYAPDQRFCPQDGTTLRLQEAGSDLVGTIVADRYHVTGKLGEGGMGQVYLAEHVKMGRKSALKVMNPGMVKDADAISRFNREAANASRINHPNVADVYDFGETPDGVIYLAMEFVDGPPLTKLIETEGPLTPQRAAAIIRQAGDALTAAHDLGIVHRDLKPDNIMIARNRDGSDCVKVVDFGIAKAADNAAQKVTKTGLVVGTPEYMSPEQLAGDKLDGRSDIYALALVAFNILTGKLPFPADTVQESMIMRLTEPPRRLAEMRPEVAWSAEVQGALDKALSRDANSRYQTASEFGKALARALERMATGTQAAPRASAALPESVAPRGSVPNTRVNRASQGDTPVAPPARRSSRALVLGGAGIILAAGIASAAMLSHKDGPPAQVSKDSVTPAGAATSGVKPRDTGRAAAQIDSVTPTTAAHGTSTSGMPPTTVSVRAVLDSLEKVVAGDVSVDQAGRVLRTLEQMKSRIKGNEQIVQAAVIEALAQGSRHDNEKACAALRRVETIAPSTRNARTVATTLSSSC